MPEFLTTGKGGWVCYEADDLDPSVFIRFEDRGGRLSAAELYLPTESGPLNTDLLRRVPLGHIEAWVNERSAAAGIRKTLNQPGPDLRRAASYFDGPGRGDHWIARMFAAQLPESEPLPPMRRLAFWKPSSKDAPADEAPVNARIDVPQGVRDYGDDFYRQVATVYAELARRTKAPGAALADANGIVVTKAHRWIREARRRGFLPRGVQGKAG